MASLQKKKAIKIKKFETLRKWMEAALKLAEKALKCGEVPVGCIFIYKCDVIAIGANTVNETKNATRHAEMNCIDIVLKKCRDKDLDFKQVFKDVDVVVTVEPCIMCSAALHELNVRQIIYGCANSRFGGCSSVFNTAKIYIDNNCEIQSGIYPDYAISLLKKFYSGSNPNAPKIKAKKNSE